MQPDWLKNATLATPAVQPQAPVQAESKPVRPVAPPGSDAERIAAARAIAVAHCREANPVGGVFGQGFPPAFYQDFGFGSAWLARHISHRAQMIETRIAGQLLPLGESHKFNPRTGIFELATFGVKDFSLADVVTAYQARIRELGLSQVLLEQWSATIHTIADEKEFYALGFDERMEIFKSAKVS